MAKAGQDGGTGRSYYSLLNQQASHGGAFQPPSRSNSSSSSMMMVDSPRSGGGGSSVSSAWAADHVVDSSGRRGARAIASGERVRVVLRIRPTIKEGETPGCLEVMAGGQGVKLYRHNAVVPETVYNFDKVLGPQSVQADIYEAAVAPVIADVMNGYNGTIMAYGQTGAGKTHTLSSIEPNNIGMMPRAAAEIFVQANNDPKHEYVVLMSYVQIYMELIQDLLRPESENLSIRENESGVFISGVQEVQVKKMEDCLHLLQLGERNRAFAFTQLNAHSSRSHAIVMLTVVKRTKNSSPGQGAAKTGHDTKVKVGKLFIVDLAGSERLKKSRSEGQRQREAKSINLSLTMLGMCINARADPNSAHVPFRDSKLTRLLQESLGGNAKTSLVLAVADVREHAEETQQSLQFGSRAMCVKTHPIINEHTEFSAEMHGQLVTAQDKQMSLEASLVAKTEAMAQLRRTLAQEQERNKAIMDALEAEKEEINEIRRRETRELEAALADKQAEVAAAEASRDAALAEAADARAARELHDGEIELLLRQWHGEKNSWSKAAKVAKERAEEEKAALTAALEAQRTEHEEEKEAFVTAWQAEVAAVTAALMDAKAELKSAAAEAKVSAIGEQNEYVDGQDSSVERCRELAAEVGAQAASLAKALQDVGREREELQDALAQREHAQGEEQQAEYEELHAKSQAASQEAANLRETLAVAGKEAAEEVQALGAKLKAAEVEVRGLSRALKAAEAEANIAEDRWREEREELHCRFQEQLSAAKSEATAAAGETPALRAELDAVRAEAERTRVAQDGEITALKTKLRIAEETVASLKQQMSRDLEEATTKVANRMAYRQQKMEELSEKKRNRESRVMVQRYEAEVAELKARHHAEEESLSSQLKAALIEKEMANGDGQRELAQRHMEEIRALRKGFKAEMALAREAWARKADEAVATLTENKNRELAIAKQAAAQRELDAGESHAAELARERNSFAAKLQEQHESMKASANEMLAREREMWEGRLGEKEKQLSAMASDFEAQLVKFRGELASEKERLGEVVAKHQFAIIALKKHHKAELARVHAQLSERAEKDIARAKESFQSELSNVSINYQVEGSELSTQISELRAQMGEQQRSAHAEAERLSSNAAQQAEVAAALRAEKEEMLAKLQLSETATHDLQLKVERLTQQLDMERERLEAESSLVSAKLSSQAELEREALLHKHSLELGSVQDALRQAEANLRAAKQEGEQHVQQLMAEHSELHARLAEVQAEAEADKRALENRVEELMASQEALQEEHREVQVEKGLLLGANRHLKERLEAMGAALEENKAMVERRRAEAVSQMEEELETVRNAAAASQAALEERIRELQRSHTEAEARQAEVNRRHAAAATIQRGFRRSRLSSLMMEKSVTEEQLAAARKMSEDLEAHRVALEAQRVAGMALTGRQLLQQTTVVAEKTMSDILTAFLVPKKDLELFHQLNRSKEALTRNSHQQLPPRPTKTSPNSLPRAHSRSRSISTSATEKAFSFTNCGDSLPISASQELPFRGQASVFDRRSTEFSRYDVSRSSAGSSIVGGRSPSGAMTAR